MTQDEVLHMAIDAGATDCANPDKWGILEISYENLKRFADLIAAHEREECAKVAENGLIGHTIAKAIRARRKNNA